MPPTLTADPNPVVVFGAGKSGNTVVHWDTGGGFEGQLLVSVDGGPSGMVSGPARSGDHPHAIVEGHSYEFQLVRVNNGSLLATKTVTAEDFQRVLIEEGAAAWELSRKINPPQRIMDLDVVPNVDSLHVSFTTSIECVPEIVVETMTGDVLERFARAPFLPDTKHVAKLGTTRPLPQGTRLRIQIKAPGPKPSMSFAQKDAHRSVIVETGTRSAVVRFTSVIVHNDSDEGGSGEFTFYFTTGDADAAVPALDYNAPEWEGDISDREKVDVNRAIPLPMCPPHVYVRVEGWEDDTFLGVPFWGPFRGIGGRDVGTSGMTGPWGDMAEVAASIDITRPPMAGPDGVSPIPFSMSTGPFHVSFTVNGVINVSATSGLGYHSLVRSFKWARQHGALQGPSAVLTGVIGTGDHGKARTLVATDGRSSVYLSVPEGDQSNRGNRWVEVATWPGGAVTPVESPQGTIELFGVDEQGNTLHWVPGKRFPEGGWVKLDLTSKGPLEAVASRSQTELFAVNSDGRVVHRVVVGGSGPDQAWQSVGDLLAVEIQAVAVPGLGTSLFALDPDGGVWHCHRRPRRMRWEAWTQICEGGIGWFQVALTDEGKCLQVAAVTGDRQLRSLAWVNYPETPPESGWSDLGDYDGWEPARDLLPESSRAATVENP